MYAKYDIDIGDVHRSKIGQRPIDDVVQTREERRKVRRRIRTYNHCEVLRGAKFNLVRMLELIASSNISFASSKL